jgi:adenylate cyclase
LLKLTALKLAVLIGVAFVAVHFFWRAASPKVFPFPELQMLESKALDIKFRRRGAVPSSGSVVVAGVDEASIQRYGLWPWKRELVARALKNLNDAGALAVAVDISYSDADRSSPHLVVNQVLDEVKQLAISDTETGAVPAGLEEAKRPSKREDLLKSSWLAQRERLLSVAALAEKKRLPNPDDLFAEAMKASPRVVLGVSGLTENEIGMVAAEVRERDEQALVRFYIDELFDPEDRHPGPDGSLIRDWGVMFKEKAKDLAGNRVPREIPAIQAPLPVIAAAVHHVGSFDTQQDADGTIRHYPLISRINKGHLLPSLALASAALALDAKVAPLKSQMEAGALDGLGLMRGDPPDGLRLKIPVDPWTGLLLINYPGPWDGVAAGKPLYDKLALADVADGRFDPARVKDKVVVVGATAAGTFDQRVTPFDSFAPGLCTHAAVIDNILTRNFLNRPGWLVFLELAFMLVLAVLFGLIIPRLRMYWQIAFMLLLCGAYAAFDMQLFKSGTVLSSVTPLLEMMALCFGLVFYNYVVADREKRQVRTAFQYYLTKSVMEEMLKHPEKLKLGGDKRELTVLFSDIRGFTTISERLPPEELVRTLNEYLTPMTDLVFKHEGTLDKYMGDAIMAIWGAPLPQEDHALRACAAAVEMLEKLEELRRRWKEQGRPDIQIGIGVNSGPMAVGNMGSDMRFDYTVMGDNVNLGSRLEGTNKQYGTRVIISEFTFALVQGKVATRELGSVRVKGKKLPVRIYELRGIGAPADEDKVAIQAFEEGVRAYRARRWDEAEALFQRVRQQWAGDGPSGHYLDDIAYKRKNPPPETWDGVYEMKTK